MKYLEQIKNYVDNTFTNNQKKEFEADCLENEELREELTFYLQAQQAVKEVQNDEWRDIYHANQSSGGRVFGLTPSRFIGMAASILLIVFAVWQGPKLYTSSQLAKQNNTINYLELDRINTAGEEDTSTLANPNLVFEQAIDLAVKGNHQAALDKVKDISETNEGYFKALEIRGICYSELKEYEKAKQVYTSYLNQENGLYKEQITWNLYLLYKNHPNENNKAFEDKERQRIWDEIKYNKSFVE